MSEAIFERMRNASNSKFERDNARSKMLLQKPVAPRKIIGDVGLELEIEGVNLPGFIDYTTPVTAVAWKAENDGSLRGENHEYITNGAVKIVEVEGALSALWMAFSKNGSKLQLSNRCSTHVHLNCSMLSPKPITSLICLYAIVEEAVTHWCGESRVSNPFCLRIVDSSSTVETWEDYLSGDRVEFSNGMKYNSLNLKPLFNMGSVEFRALRGADNPDIVLKWVNFLWALREEARTTYQNPLKLAQDVSARGVLGVIEGIVDKHGLQDFWKEVRDHELNGHMLDQTLRRGFLLIQRLLFSVKWDSVPDREENGEAPEDFNAQRAKALRLEQHNELRAELLDRILPPAVVDLEEARQAFLEAAGPPLFRKPRFIPEIDRRNIDWAEELDQLIEDNAFNLLEDEEDD